jgi:predicted aspartyl protease
MQQDNVQYYRLSTTGLASACRGWKIVDNSERGMLQRIGVMPVCSPSRFSGEPGRLHIPTIIAALAMACSVSTLQNDNPHGPTSREAARPVSGPTVVIPFQFDPLKSPYILLTARVNGSKPMLFMLDTGLNAPILLMEWAAKELGVFPSSRSSKPGLPNSGKGTDLRTDITLVSDNPDRDAVIDGVPTFIRNFPKVEENVSESRIAGVIGIPLLKPFTVQIDFSGKKMTLFADPQDAPVGKGVTTIKMSEQRGFIFVPIRVNTGRQTNLLLDTGSSLTIIPATAMAGNVAFSSTSSGYMTPEGRLEFSRRVLLPDLKIGELTAKEMPATVQPPTEDPTMGTDLLSRYILLIDFPRKRITFRVNENAKGPQLRGTIGAQVHLIGDRYQIGSLTPGLPAAKAGLHKGDFILEVDSETFRYSSARIAQSVLSGWAGEPIQLLVERPNGKKEHLSFRRESEFTNDAFSSSGMMIRRLENNKAFISYVSPGSPAAKLGLSAGDQVMELNGHRLQKMSAQDFAHQFGTTTLKLKVKRKAPPHHQRVVRFETKR